MLDLILIILGVIVGLPLWLGTSVTLAKGMAKMWHQTEPDWFDCLIASIGGLLFPVLLPMILVKHLATGGALPQLPRRQTRIERLQREIDKLERGLDE